MFDYNHLQKMLPEITSSIVKNYQPQQIILFGSLADEREDAGDIDLFLVKDTETKRHIDRVREVRKFLPAEVPVDLIVYTPVEFDNALNEGSYLVEDILNQGKIIYESKR